MAEEDFRRYREEREAQEAGVRGEERRILTQHWHIRDDFCDEETPPADLGDEIPTFKGEPWTREEREQGIFWNCKSYNNFSNCCQCRNKVLDWHFDGHPVSETGKGDDPNRFFTTWENGRWVHKDLPSADITNADNIIEQASESHNFQRTPRTSPPSPSELPTPPEGKQWERMTLNVLGEPVEATVLVKPKSPERHTMVFRPKPHPCPRLSTCRTEREGRGKRKKRHTRRPKKPRHSRKSRRSNKSNKRKSIRKTKHNRKTKRRRRRQHHQQS